MTEYNITFSYSAWSMWEKCPRQYKFAKIDKLPTPTNPAFVKGRRVHTAMEKYVKGELPERPTEARLFTALADGLRDTPAGLKIVEEQMAFDRAQLPVSWFGKTAFYRYVWDVAVLDDPVRPTHIEMADWKTGKMYGSYDAQMQIFAIPAYLRFPSLQSFAGNLIYLESGDSARTVYTRAQFENGLNDLWKSNAAMMASNRAFDPKPSRDACRFCDFHAKKGGPCRDGV